MSSLISTTSATMTASPTITSYDRVSWLASTGTPEPPPGVTPNYNSPNPNGVAMIVINIVGVILCATITAMRLWTKGVLMRTAGWDDYTCIISMIGIFIWTIAQVKCSLIGYGRASYDILISHGLSELHGKLEYISQAVYLFSIGAVKVSILFMYLRAFTGSQENLRFKYTVWVLISLITSAHLVAFFGWVFSQLPPTCHWTYYPNPGEWEKHCYVTVIDDPLASYSLFLNVFTVVMDIIILTLPIRPVWRLQLAKRQKISILLILFAGVIVTIASLLRLVFFVSRFFLDAGGDSVISEFRVNLITTFELDIAQLCCCLPILKPFVRQYMPSILRLGTFTSRSKERGSTHPTAVSQHPSKTGRKWPGGSRDEELIGSNYLEIGEDGKSDQSYVMSTMVGKEDEK